MAHRVTRRNLLATTAGGLLATAVPLAGANAQDAWPNKPIKVIMPFGAGGSMDVLSRLLAPIVSESLGQQVVVENRPGATGTVAMAAVAAAPADGYTLMFTGSSYSIIALLMPNLPFKMDAFTPLSRLTVGPTLMAVPAQLGIKTMAEFVAAAKKQPGKWSYGSSGIGTSVHLGGELFKMAAGVDLAHVPYRATPAIVADLLENRLQMSVLGVADCRQYVASGQLRALAVSYTERMPEFPDVPTFAEVGYPNVRASNDFGISIRADTPAPIKARLEEAYRSAVRRPEIVQRLKDFGLIVVATSSADFTRVLAEDAARYSEVIRVANVKLE
ncbi:tripartite tricarboxylate transporter substrate binding protein [Reyranella sp. MMS21-HV4-11]|jgi:tripartite-type tricarboxylate transporter receptor subunit TctC|uniref:Tripartite tricarboxylate transporter substrate binding protein n=1 Tax=Reyranella humidisoli TaxID=2849149 RepID=A0ABS6IIE1_9HYPH|nr:tripartite tricarboxylate transporter substrate binding protein [Reyranella sp. MMS21-HV4-11]MBU8873015.1 tripartite tricarboxylate transporter substrate binding protein [Reyranella sp. MMS21-HV4-11]